MKRHSHIWKILIFDMFIIEFGPVGVFLITYYLTDFPTAAISLGIATLIALILSRTVNKRIPWFAIYSGTITIITSFITYLYEAPWVLILKDTIYYYLFAGILIFSLYKRKYIFESFFGHVFAIEKKAWRILEKRWLVFFILAGTANEIVRISLSTDEWVLYKQIVIVIFLIFGLLQFQVSSSHRLANADKLGLRKHAAK